MKGRERSTVLGNTFNPGGVKPSPIFKYVFRLSARPNSGEVNLFSLVSQAEPTG